MFDYLFTLTLIVGRGCLIVLCLLVVTAFLTVLSDIDQ
jgi:hypothetical protein